MPYSSHELRSRQLDQLLDPDVILQPRLMVMCERWLCAPRSEIFFEHGHRLVTGTTT